MNVYLLRKVKMDYPICDKTHDIEERKRIIILTIKGKRVGYEKRYYHRSNTYKKENKFETGSMLNGPLTNAWKRYQELISMCEGDAYHE